MNPYDENYILGSGSLVRYAQPEPKARGLKANCHPTTSIDIGCHEGFFVYHLRKLGVVTQSADISEYALSVAPPEISEDRTQGKPYFLAEDYLEGIIHGLCFQKKQCDIFNIGVSSAITVTMIAEILGDEMKLKNVGFKYTSGDLGRQADHSSDETVHIATRKILGKELEV